MIQQLALPFDIGEEYVESPLNTRRIKLFDDLNEYQKILVSFSGGKDSLAGLLFFLEEGVPREKIELWHQSIDGQPGGAVPFADWPITEDYVRIVGEALGIKVRFQWREGGYLGELMRENRMSLEVGFETNSNIICLPTLRGSISTRRKFPAKSPDLSRRWCSSNLKIEVFSRSLSNFPEYKGDLDNPLKILVFTGERREESSARARYAETEEHRCSTRGRIVHHYRSVIDYTEEQIWQLIEKWRIVPHPAYFLGYSRTSCFPCVFFTPDHWAMLREIAPERFNLWREKEKELGFTVDSKFNLDEMANQGSLKRLPKGAKYSKWLEKALKGEFTAAEIITDQWELPAGAFRGAEGGSL